MAEMLAKEPGKPKPDVEKKQAEKLFSASKDKFRDSAAQYVLLCEVRDRGIEIAEWPLVRQSIDALSTKFQLAALPMYAEALDRFAPKATAAPAAKSSAKSALAQAENALEAGEFEMAERLAQLARDLSKRSKDSDLQRDAIRLVNVEIGQRRAQWDKIEQARAKVATDPSDAEAQLLLGRFLCFSADDWEAGLSHLAQGSDATLKELAAASLKELATPDESVELGDDWREKAQKAKPDARRELMLGARRWYSRAIPWLTGSAKTTAEKRLAEANSTISSIKPSGASFHTSPRRPELAVVPFDAEAAKKYQRQWADFLNVAPAGVNSVGMQLVLIPAGEFTMGTPAKDLEALVKAQTTESNKKLVQSEGPQHRVRLTQPFYLACHEVTIAQYKQFVTATGHKTVAETDKDGGYAYDMDGKGVHDKKYNWRFPGYEPKDEEPVTNVAYADVLAYLEWLNRKEGGSKESPLYRLPTEAEWEFACRGGAATKYHFGDDSKNMSQYQQPSDKRTHPVGGKKPNQFGLFDMLGNALEWCSDWYEADYYSHSPTTDPTGPSAIARGQHVVRSIQGDSRSARRAAQYSGSRNPTWGFRLVRVTGVATPGTRSTTANR